MGKIISMVVKKSRPGNRSWLVIGSAVVLAERKNGDGVGLKERWSLQLLVRAYGTQTQTSLRYVDI